MSNANNTLGNFTQEQILKAVASKVQAVALAMVHQEITGEEAAAELASKGIPLSYLTVFFAGVELKYFGESTLGA